MFNLFRFLKRSRDLSKARKAIYESNQTAIENAIVIMSLRAENMDLKEEIKKLKEGKQCQKN